MKRIMILSASVLGLFGVGALAAAPANAAEPRCSVVRVKVYFGNQPPIVNLCLLNDVTG
ncbi:MAG: hypothetical protein QOJ00_2137 [Actinomycetota bacterium]|jgi:hypothetical protein